jgi:hypothetical protein
MAHRLASTAIASKKKSDDPASEARQKTAREHFERRDWGALWQFKKTCKKGWPNLGFTKREIETITFYKPDWI